MFLSRRFFWLIAFIVVLSASGYWYAPLYPVARGMVWLTMGLLVADYALLRLLGKVQASRTCADKFCLNDDNDVHLRLRSEAPFTLRLVVRDELPAEFRYHRAVFHLKLKKGAAKTITYTLHPTQRGSYGFGHVLCFVSSPLGLIELKRKQAEPCNVKVYPLFRKLYRYELAAVSENVEQGTKRIRRAGAQTEFEQIKEFVNGDEFRAINWKATARARRLMVNTYQDEKAQPIYCVIDKGRAMQRTHGGMTLLDYAINAALALSYVALRHDDMAGLISFADKVDTFLPASRRSSQLPLMLEQLYAQTSHYAESDFDALTATIGRQLRRRGLLVVYTDFDGFAAMQRQFAYLKLLARHHCLLVVFFKDEEIAAVADNQPHSANDYIVHTMAASFTLEKRTIATALTQAGIYSVLTSPRQLAVNVIRKYIELKQRGVV